MVFCFDVTAHSRNRSTCTHTSDDGIDIFSGIFPYFRTGGRFMDGRVGGVFELLRHPRVGVIIDVAHSGLLTSLEAAQASQRPIVASHSGVWELTPHCRCKNDDVIRAIVDTGGLIGITNIPAFLGKSGDIAALLDHIDYVASRYGTDYVAIGTDNPYTAASVYEQQSPAGRPARTRWEALWPDDDPLFSPIWKQERQIQSLVGTNWPLFTVGLVQRGYADEAIRKIIGGNMLPNPGGFAAAAGCSCDLSAPSTGAVFCAAASAAWFAAGWALSRAGWFPASF